MKIKKIIPAFIIVFLVLFNTVVFTVSFLREKRLSQSIKVKRAGIEKLTIDVPARGKAKVEKKRGWEIHSFTLKRFILRVSIAHGNELTLEKVVKYDLNLNTLPEGQRLCLSKLCIVKRIKEIPHGFYFIRHKKKVNKFAFAFYQKGTIYYIDLFAFSSLKGYKEFFDSTISSITVEGTPLFKDRDKIKKELKEVEPECYIVCKPADILITGLPTTLGFLMLLTFFVFTKNMGKLPDNLVVSGIIPVYSEEDIDTFLRLFTKREWFLTSIVIENNGIHLYYRKKEMIFLNKEKAKTTLKYGKSLFGQYIEGEFDKELFQNPPLSIKLCLCKRVNLRFYTPNAKKIITFIEN